MGKKEEYRVKIPTRQRLSANAGPLRFGAETREYTVLRGRFPGPRKKFYGPADFAGSIPHAFAVSKPHRAVILRVWPFCEYC